MNLKTDKCSPSTLSYTNCFAVHTKTLLRNDCDRDHMAVVVLLFSKRFPFAGPFAVHINISQRSKFIHFSERFQEVPFSVTDRRFTTVDGRPIRRKRSCVFKFIRLSVQGRSLSNDMYVLFRNSAGMFIRWLEGKRIRWYKFFRCIKQKALRTKELILHNFFVPSNTGLSSGCWRGSI